MKHGTPEQCRTLAEEMLPHLLELTKGPYSHFLVSKLIANAPKKTVPGHLLATPCPVPQSQSINLLLTVYFVCTFPSIRAISWSIRALLDTLQN